MATMMKEKRREKKKTKEKHVATVGNISEQPSVSEVVRFTSDKTICIEDTQKNVETPKRTINETFTSTEVLEDSRICNAEQIKLETSTITQEANMANQVEEQLDVSVEVSEDKPLELVTSKTVDKNVCTELNNVEIRYSELSSTLARMSIPEENAILTSERIMQLENTYKLIEVEENEVLDPLSVLETEEVVEEDALPSAPVFEEYVPQYEPLREVVKNIRPKVQSMPLEEAVNIYGGAVIAEVRAMSDREEAIVEAGPVSGPEHPLVDLLTTFRSSIIAIDNERTKIARGYAEEEKLRSTLWKVEKKTLNVSEPCRCGATISFRATYEHAQLMKERLPVAKLRLESLLKDVQESYCHYQHAALLAYYQIEELISETIQTNKLVIREALSLILQALRLSDGAPGALSNALQRWAAALASALVDTRDLRDLLFLLHHLFRQTRSVVWAARAIRLNVVDGVSAAQAIAVLDLLLATHTHKLDTALECTEVETEEAWEEVDRRGEGCAVREGALRERDLLAALRALPLRSLVATLVLFTQQDVNQSRPEWWGDASYGRGVVRACCGVRTLLSVLQRAVATHAHYARLKHALRTLAARALRALAALHLHSRTEYPYSDELGMKIEAELEAAFSAGFTLFGTDELHELPTSLLTNDTAREYCLTFITGLHDKTAKQLESLSITIPVLPCDVRVSIVTQAAVDRTEDHGLARMVIELLFQIGIKRNTVQCKGTCDAAARECMSALIDAHPYLQTFGLHVLADINQAESLDASAVKALQVHKWRPNTGEVVAVLDDWAQRCPQLLQYLLLHLDYTPDVGLSVEVQVVVGQWVVGRAGAGVCPEWAWRVLRALRLRGPAPAPAPAAPPPHPLAAAFAVLATPWGHSIPLICTEGVSALCTVAATRVPDAVHCLAPVMLAMAHSPESVSLTPKFTELFSSVFGWGPGLVQRALGRGGAGGGEMLLRLMLAQLEGDRSGSPRADGAGVASAWLRALWGPVPAAWGPALEGLALAAPHWGPLDEHATLLTMSENSKEYVATAVRNASQAPLLCECILRAYHTQREVRTQLYARLLNTLRMQRVAGQRIHVDNALNQIGFMMSSEELVIYKTAAAVLVAPPGHPSHLTLWRLLLHLYLQRPPDDMHESSPPIGPLFFSGLIKSRTLVQIKKRLQETLIYHQTEAETLKLKHDSIKSIDIQSVTKVVKEKSNDGDDNLLPALSITDLTAESSEAGDSDDSLSEGEEREEIERSKREEEDNNENKILCNLICYHNAAEKLIRAYSRWVEEGDKVRALPHHADISRFIPEQAMSAAWQQQLSRIRPPPDTDDRPPPPPPPSSDAAAPKTPFNIALENITSIPETKRRPNKNVINSPVEEVNITDSRTLLAVVDKHLKDIERLAQEWCTEVHRVTSLDASLWELVSGLRARRAVPPVRKQCSNRCKPTNIIIPAEEWCVSAGAERGIKENRASARACLRRVARARPLAARAAAALLSAARRVSSSEAARRVAERAWRSAGAGLRCAHAHTTIATLVSLLAERWLCAEGLVCAELLSKWSESIRTELQQELCGLLVDPRRVSPALWPLVYYALLRANLPEHTLFSYLSKFDMSRWSQSAEPAERRDLLEKLLTAAQRWGPTPQAQQQAVLELLGVHTSAVLAATHLCAHIVQCVQASVAGRLPASHWGHVVKAVNIHAAHVAFDQLGNVLRETGVLWWEARTSARNSEASYAPYAAHTGRLLHAMLRAFVASALQLSYAPERVSWYAWHALQESWSPWITPHCSTPLLPSTAEDEAYTAMLALLVETITQIMLDCPGTEEYLLQQVFEWAVQVFSSVRGGQESSVQMSALLAALDHLPWADHQWFYGKALQVALQICPSPDKEITSWCCKTFRDTSAETLVKGIPDEQLAPSLAALLYLLTANTMSHSLKLLVEASRLPWWRLPEEALDEAMERFFAQHHSSVQPYHELPQFKVILYASELIIHEDTPAHARSGGRARSKRARGVSQCVRAHSAPALAAHAAPAAAHLLHTLALLAPHLEDSGDELEELLTRAVIIMCMEPVAAAVLPVWVRWVSRGSERCVRAGVSAVAALTAFEYFAPLADAAVKALLHCKESPGWGSVRVRWSACPWRECAPLCARARLYAARAAARDDAYSDLRTAFNALLAADINFVENEAIVAVWICVACRVARGCSGSGEQAECRDAGSKLIARWADQPRRSLLRVVTLQADSDRPTARHRLLCRLAQCVLAPEPGSPRAYEAACAALLGAAPGDVTTWGRSPHPKRLPRLAVRLFPTDEVYFKEELDLAPEPN